MHPARSWRKFLHDGPVAATTNWKLFPLCWYSGINPSSGHGNYSKKRNGRSSKSRAGCSWEDVGRAGQHCDIFPQALFIGFWSQPGWMLVRLTQELQSTPGRKIHMINNKGTIKPHSFPNINLIFTTININRSEMESLQSRCKLLQAACAGGVTATSYYWSILSTSPKCFDKYSLFQTGYNESP